MGPQREFVSYFLLEDPLDPIPQSKPSSAKYSVSISMDGDWSYDGDSWNGDDGTETNEGRLSRSLRSWMPDHVIKPLVPKEKPPREPVFSARLGKDRSRDKTNGKSTKMTTKGESRSKTAPVRRVPSDESIVTRLSLLSCSSREEDVEEISLQKQRRRRRRRHDRDTFSSTGTTTPQTSIWVQLAGRKRGILADFSRAQTVAKTSLYAHQDMYNDEFEAFKFFEPDEQRQLFRTGLRKGIKLVNGLTKSGSMTNIADNNLYKRRRALSAGAKKPHGKEVDLQGLHRQFIERKIAEEQARQQEKQLKQRGRRSLSRQATKLSLLTTSSGPSSPPSTSAPSSEIRPMSPSDQVPENGSQEQQVTIWKGDREILEIDLKKDLTVRVKKRIATTTTALSKATGLGDDNRYHTVVGVHEEFPMHVDDDYSHHPRIVQRVRISPHLSDVIRDDIKVRMGRPRYHEIRTRDLEMWNKDQSLGRAHRNLKVFTWLHSLKENEFYRNTVPIIEDRPTGPDEKEEFINIPAADEPEVKPLYKAYEVRIL